MGCKTFMRYLESDLAWTLLRKIETTSITFQIPEPMRLPCAVQFLKDHAHTWWKTIVWRYDGRLTITRADFQTEFEEKYYSKALWEKWIEFINLK